MKKILFVLIFVSLLFSCKKENVTPDTPMSKQPDVEVVTKLLEHYYTELPGVYSKFEVVLTTYLKFNNNVSINLNEKWEVKTINYGWTSHYLPIDSITFIKTTSQLLDSTEISNEYKLDAWVALYRIKTKITSLETDSTYIKITNY